LLGSFLYFLVFLFLFLVFPWSSLSFLCSFKLASMINLLAFLGCHFLLTCFLEEISLPFWIWSKSWSRVVCKQPDKKNSNKCRAISRVQMRGGHYCFKHSWQEVNDICRIPCRNETRLLPVQDFGEFLSSFLTWPRVAGAMTAKTYHIWQPKIFLRIEVCKM
jgi:hypothetical protein